MIYRLIIDQASGGRLQDVPCRTLMRGGGVVMGVVVGFILVVF